MSNLIQIAVPGTISKATVDADGIVQFGLTHTTERREGAPLESTFTVVCENKRMAKWVSEHGLIDGETVMVFTKRMKEFRDASGPWLTLYADNFVLVDDEGPLMVSGLLVGNVGNDPEMAYTPRQTAYTKANVAVEWSERNSDNTGWLKETTWTSCTFWGSAGEGNEGQAGRSYDKLAKGARVQIDVRDLHAREYTDKSGVQRLSVDITAGIFRLENAPRQQQQPTINATPGIRRPGAAAAAVPQSVVAAAMAAQVNGIVTNMPGDDMPF